MIGVQIGNGAFIDFAKINFKCPICDKEYFDSNDTYLNRCNQNISGCTSINCECGVKFMMTYDMTGDAVSFIPKIKRLKKS